jgi:hypothetical protein
MKRLLTTVALLLWLATPAFAGQTAAESAEEDARNYGYDTAALETCPGLIVTNPKRRAQLDRKYRNSPVFLETYAGIVSRPRAMVCDIATGGADAWLARERVRR